MHLVVFRSCFPGFDQGRYFSFLAMRASGAVFRAVTRDDVDESVGRVGLLGKGIAKSLEICLYVFGGAAVDGSTFGKEQDLIEALEDALSRLMDDGDCCHAQPADGSQKLHDAGRAGCIQSAGRFVQEK